MRIAIIGQSAFGKAVLEAIVALGKDEIVGAFPPPDSEGRPFDPLKEAAIELSVPVHQYGRYRTPEAIDAFRSLDADLCVMAFVTDIVPDEMIEAPKLGTIQYHPSLLPLHRGPSSINWAIINGDTKTGLTIFWPDKGLDTGPVLLQKEAEITPDDTVGSVYFNHLFPMGVEALVEGVELVRAGNPPRIVQDESKATYESWTKASDGEIDWSKPVAEVYNLIRGCNPQPGANTLHNGVTLKIFDSERIDGATDAAPGTVTAVGDDGFRVAAHGGEILVKRVQPPKSKKVPAAEYVGESGLAAGDVLGN
ncbi:MAG: methionyl-tRNA formyltransferase [Chloroflexi bacterium]|nr:methionyl-tRNA formyltransferase [Chloroflexota bacterium]